MAIPSAAPWDLETFHVPIMFQACRNMPVRAASHHAAQVATESVDFEIFHHVPSMSPPRWNHFICSHYEGTQLEHMLEIWSVRMVQIFYLTLQHTADQLRVVQAQEQIGVQETQGQCACPSESVFLLCSTIVGTLTRGTQSPIYVKLHKSTHATLAHRLHFVKNLCSN